MDEMDGPTKLCKQCCLQIPAQAKICTHCQSPQDWRGFFSISNTVLALVTALVSVLAVAGPNLYRFVHSPASQLSEPLISLEGTAIRVMVNNNGDAPGMYVRAVLHSDYLAGATQIRLRDDHSTVVSAGTNLLMFDIIPLLTKEESYRASVKMIERLISNKEPDPTEIVFQFAESDGTWRVARLKFDGDMLFQMLRANFDRCSAVKEPNFENGCIGPGAAPDSPPGTTFDG